MIWGRKKDKEEYQLLDERYNALLGDNAELSYELSQWKASHSQMQEQEEEVRRLHENVRRLKHDMKNHMMVIASYLNGGEYEQAKQYTSTILDKLNGMQSYIETGNSLLSHILNEKLNLARTQGISVKAEIENVFFGKMESLDFSALLSNILDNAIEACKGEAEKQLYVRISARKGYDTILVKNGIGKSILKDNPTLKTTKEESCEHGMGTVQIRTIVEKYQGLCDFYEEESWFCVAAFIPSK